VIDRRTFLAGTGAVLLGAPLAAEGQQAGTTPRVVVQWGLPLDRELAVRMVGAFDTGLHDLGWENGSNIRVEHRGSDGTVGQLQTAAAQVVASRPDVIVVGGTVGAVTMHKATTALPVVFFAVGVPVEIGLVASLSRPGGNMTGVTFEAATETYGKRLQLLKNIVPTLVRVGILYAIGDPNVDHARQASEAAAASLGIQLQPVGVRDAGELPDAFPKIKRDAQAVLVVAGVLTSTNSQRIAELTLANRIPSCGAFKDTVVFGGLMSYGPDLVQIVRQAVPYVDKILKGAKPGDLPVEEPTKFELVINLKTAKALGLTIPPSLLQRADEIIQ
jgi:putative tryptophan/tyrosine transport system substrate-binding protein